MDEHQNKIRMKMKAHELYNLWTISFNIQALYTYAIYVIQALYSTIYELTIEFWIESGLNIESWRKGERAQAIKSHAYISTILKSPLVQLSGHTLQNIINNTK